TSRSLLVKALLRATQAFSTGTPVLAPCSLQAVHERTLAAIAILNRCIATPWLFKEGDTNGSAVCSAANPVGHASAGAHQWQCAMRQTSLGCNGIGGCQVCQSPPARPLWPCDGRATRRERPAARAMRPCSAARRRRRRERPRRIHRFLQDAAVDREEDIPEPAAHVAERVGIVGRAAKALGVGGGHLVAQPDVARRARVVPRV